MRPRRIALLLAIVAVADLILVLARQPSRAARVVDKFLGALRSGATGAAFEMTTYAEAVPAAGVANSRAHFIAFWRDHPIETYEINRSSAPFLAEVTFRDGAHRQIPVAVIDDGIVYPLDVRTIRVRGGPVEAVHVDGVPVEVV